MRILVATSNVSVGLSVSRCMTAAGHTVDIERQANAVAQRSDVERPDVVVVDTAIADFDWTALVQRLRATAQYVYIVILGHGHQELLSAFNCGADDYVKVPFDRAELVARLLPAERVRARLANVQEPIDEAVNQITNMPAWLELDDRTRVDLGEMLAVECLQRAPQSEWSAAHVVQLAFTLAEQRVGVTFYLAAEASSLSAVTGLLLGAPETDPTVLNEVASEVANTLGGSYKRAAISSGLNYTTGLPQLSSLESMHNASRTAASTKTWGIGWGNESVTLLATVLRKDNCSVAVEKLREGMVLSTEVRNPSGALLVASGTRLTQTAIAHIHKALGGRAQLLVSEVA